MLELYYWEGDPEAEELIEELKSKGIEFEAELLDPEIPNAAPSVQYRGKYYDSIDEFREKVKL